MNDKEAVWSAYIQLIDVLIREINEVTGKKIVSFGYIGNLSSSTDDRIWTVWRQPLSGTSEISAVNLMPYFETYDLDGIKRAYNIVSSRFDDFL